MTVDFTKFPFPGVENPHAATLTEAITLDPVSSGFVVVAIKDSDDDLLTKIRTFAAAVRSDAAKTGLVEITAYRRFRLDELGGAIPFDQAICEMVVKNARENHAGSEQYPIVAPALKMADTNDIADWTLLAEYETTDQASAVATAWERGEDESFAALTEEASSRTIGAFKNGMRYASVSRDPNVIQFFNFFPGPGDLDVLWASWQEALPWFFETGEMRSSHPLVALDPDQPLLIINYAHFDSIKHFFLGVCYDPNYLDTVTRCYTGRGFALPMPFFCKIEPV